MIPDWIVIAYLLSLLVLANLPFVNQRLFLVIPVAAAGKLKSFWWRLVEWVIYFVIGMALGLYIEYALTGIEAKDWIFWSVAASIFAVFSAPGFIWQYQLRKHLQA